MEDMEKEYDSVRKINFKNTAEEDSIRKDRKRFLEGRISALEKMVEMRKNSYSPEQLETEMNNWSEQGGPGMQRTNAALREEHQELKPTTE